jgi:hypothetical protein
MEVHIEALLELVFFPQPSNFGVEAHIEARTGVALIVHELSCSSSRMLELQFVIFFVR